MRLNIQVKKLGKRVQTVGSAACELANRPATLRELICALVKQGVTDYNDRIRRKEPGRAISDLEMQDMAQVGKIAFGIHHSAQEADLQKAIDTAILGFTDGLYRFFVGEQEITELDAPLRLAEGDAIAIIRLVMLTGGFF